MQRATLLILLLCGVTFLAGLGRPAIGDSDEAFYAEAAREMVERGDWLTPRYNYEPRFQKPILFYWLVAATYTVAGIGETQARLWAALSGVGLSMVVLAAGRRWFDARTAIIASAIVATTFGYFSIGRLALPDLPLAFFITVAICAALAGTLDDDIHATAWLHISGAAAGCAFLTKGPVGVLIPAVVLIPIWIFERQRFRLTPPRALGAIAIALAVGAPWYLAMAAAHGTGYLASFFVGDNLERFATSRFNDPRPLWFYLPIGTGRHAAMDAARRRHRADAAHGLGPTPLAVSAYLEDDPLGRHAAGLLHGLDWQAASIHPAHPPTAGAAPRRRARPAMADAR